MSAAKKKAKKKKKRGGGKAASKPARGASPEITESKPPATPRDWRGFAISTSLAVLSGCMWFLACADFDIWPLAWVAMVPAFIAIERAGSRRSALFYGWLAGLVANLGGFYWVSTLLSRFAKMPMFVGVIGLLALAAYQALVFWFFTAAVRSLRQRWRARTGKPLPMALLAPIAMVTFELLVPFLFPWYLAITQAWVVPIIQVAELTGPLGVTALLMMVNGAVYDAIANRNDGWRARWLPAGAALAILAAVLVFGVVRMAQIDDARAAAPTVTVGIVQGNIPFNEKGLDKRELRARQLRMLQTLSERLESEGAELLVWSESSHPYPIPRSATEDHPPGHAQRIRRGFRAPLLFGAVTDDRTGKRRKAWNSALMLNRAGEFVGRFDKIFLLLFGEYTPLADTFDWVRNLRPKAASQFERGENVTTFPFEKDGVTYRLAPMICYEDILTDFNRKLGKLRPHLLVNVTNDAWFGETSEPWEHLALSVYRAVELRSDMVRAVNTGVSAFIDANGRVVQETYAVDPAVNRRPASGHLGEVVLMEGGHTFFMRFGDLFGYGCLGALLGLFLFDWRRRR